MNSSESYFKNLFLSIIIRIRDDKTITLFTISKIFEIVFKLFLILLLPIVYGFITTAYIQTFLTLVFMTSVLLIAGSDNWLLKQMTKLDLNQSVAIHNFNSSAILTLKLSILLLFMIFVLQLVPINNLPVNVFKENWLSIFISSISFSIICILSWSFRGLGKILLSQIFSGLYWPTILICIITFDYFFKDIFLSEIDIISLFTLFLFLPVPFYYIFFYKYIKKNIPKKNNQNSNTKSVSSKYSKLYFFFQSASSVGISWLPIFLAGFFLSENEVGIFSTNYRIAFGIFTALIIVNFISAKKFSKLFQVSSFKKLSKEYKFFSIISSILGLLLFFCAMIILYFLQSSTSYSINTYQIYFFIIITSCTFFGPTDMILNMCNQEKLNKDIAMYTLFALIILFSLSIKYLGINSGYISLGIVIFLKYLSSLYFVKKRIFKI